MIYCHKPYFRNAVSTYLLLVSAATITFLQTDVFAGCGNDNECKGDRICVDNQCVDPAPAAASAAVTQVSAPQPAQPPAIDTISTESVGGGSSTAPVEIIEPGNTPDIRYVEESTEVNKTIPPLGPWDVWFNPIGFIQFGPTAGFEIRTAQNFYVGIHSRYAAMGMLYNSLLESRADEESNYSTSAIEVSPKSAAVGAEFKYYIPFPGHANMLYFGMFGEYMWGGYTAFENIYKSYDPYNSSSTYSSDQKAVYDAIHKSIGMGAMVGHRWRFGESRKVLLTAGLITGVARPFFSTKTFISTKQTIDMPQRNEFIFMAELALGYGM